MDRSALGLKGRSLPPQRSGRAGVGFVDGKNSSAIEFGSLAGAGSCRRCGDGLSWGALEARFAFNLGSARIAERDARAGAALGSACNLCTGAVPRARASYPRPRLRSYPIATAFRGNSDSRSFGERSRTESGRRIDFVCRTRSHRLAAEEPVVHPAQPLRPAVKDPGVQAGVLETVEPPPPANGTSLRIPLAGTPASDVVEVNIRAGLVTIVARDAPLGQVLALLAQQQGLNIITGEDIKTPVSVTLNRVPFQTALENILAVAGYTAVQQDNVLLITSVAGDRKAASQVQGRVVRVFRLDYTSATTST